MSRRFGNLLLCALALVIAAAFAVDAGARSGGRAGHHHKLRKGHHHKLRKGPKMAPVRIRLAPVRGPRPPKPPNTPAPSAAPASAPGPTAPTATGSGPGVSPPAVAPPVVPPGTTPPVTTPPGTTPPATTPPAAIGPLDVVTPFPAGMSLFAPTSFWNRPLPGDEPLDPRSDQLSTALLDEVRAEMPTRKGPWINMNAWSVPVYTVGTDVPRVHVTLDTGVVQLQRDFDSVPIPAGAHASAGTDRHLVIYQPATDTMWEFYRAQLLADGWHARWGGKMSGVSSNPGYFPNPFGASATSLPLLGGLTTIAELRAGTIDHALAMAVPNTDAAHVTWPAQRGDGRVTGATAIPQGTQFRIDPSVDLSKLRLTPVGLAFARAAQRYGMVVRDSADCVTFYAEDPTVSAAPNPYPQILGGLYPDQALKNFPWDRLRVVAPRTP
jgi:hypothetical protein